ncbi:MAG: sensor histidine kinase [Stenotrophobium sp.]
MKRQAENRLSLRRSLLRQLLAPLLLVLLASTALSYGAAAHFSHEEYDAFLYDSVQTLAHQVRPGPGGPVLDLPKAAEKVFLFDETDITYYRVFGERSGEIAGYPGMPSTLTSVESFRGVTIGSAAVNGVPVRVATMVLDTLQLGDKVYVQVAETQRRRGALTRQILVSVLVPQFCLILIVALVISRGVRRGLEPLLGITSSLEQQSYQRLRPIPDEGAPSEVHALTHALNDLLARLEQAMAAQRQFIADAAHQLRTPLTALKLNLDRALREQDPRELHAVLEQLRLSTDRAARLSRQLLSLARAESGSGHEDRFTALDLRAIAQETGAEWVPAALEHGIDLSFEAPSAALTIRGDAVLLREAIANLLDNAVKYGRRGGHAVLAVAVEGARIALSVRDDGPGIPPELRERVFERFVRGDAGGDGTGLGLAIVRDIGLLHAAEIRCGAGLDDRGFGISLYFSRSQPAS